MTTCIVKGCERERMPAAANGAVYAHCDSHLRQILRESFAPVSWTERARAGLLPPKVTGGVPR